MKFKAWQTTLIRKCLHNYRVKEGHGEDDPLPLSHLFARLQEFAVEESPRIHMRSRLSFKYEPLRRFAKGPKNVLSDDDQQLIADFLIDEGHMEPEALMHPPEPSRHPGVADPIIMASPPRKLTILLHVGKYLKAESDIEVRLIIIDEDKEGVGSMGDEGDLPLLHERPAWRGKCPGQQANYIQ